MYYVRFYFEGGFEAETLLLEDYISRSFLLQPPSWLLAHQQALMYPTAKILLRGDFEGNLLAVTDNLNIDPYLDSDTFYTFPIPDSLAERILLLFNL